MKILILSTKPPWPPHDGGAVATLRCIEGLTENGATVSVLAMRTHKHLSPNDNRSSPEPQIEYESVAVNTRLRPTMMAYNLLFSNEPYDLERFHSPLFSERLRCLLKNETFEIIQCEGLAFTYYLNEIRHATDAPVILRAHNIEHRIRERMSHHATGKIRKAYLESLAQRLKKRETEAANSFDAIVPISSHDMQWFTGIAPGKPVYLMETGAVTLLDQYCNVGNPHVGFVGALDWKPNADGLLWFLKYVWPQILDRLPSARLKIAGRNASSRLKKMLMGRNVTYEGEVDDSIAFTDALPVMIAPLFAGSGIRIKIIEAMSRGKTVVATPAAAEGLPVTSGKELLIAATAEQFGNAVYDALTIEELRKTIGTGALALVRKKFDNRQLTKGLLDMYNDLLNDR